MKHPIEIALNVARGQGTAISREPGRTKIPQLSHYDLTIIGGGVVGLWTAYFAAREGRSVMLVERERIGAGASGGVLGALMPHQPHPWNAKKQSQFDALVELEALCRSLESETGQATGYRRAGRLMPIRTESQRERQIGWASASQGNWVRAEGEPGYQWLVCGPDEMSGYLSSSAIRNGHAFDDLSAVVSPRALLSALNAALMPLITIREGDWPVRWDEVARQLVLDHATFQTDRIVIAAGANSTAVMERLGFESDVAPPITGVKGQAALLRPAGPLPRDMPLIYGDGLYLVPHPDGTVGIGSTTEKQWDDPVATDDRLERLIEQAIILCPWLNDCEIVERWARLRPKGPTSEPVVKAVSPRIFLASGGYKTGLALAPAMARQALSLATD